MRKSLTAMFIFWVCVGLSYGQSETIPNLDDGLNKMASDIGGKMELDNRMDVAIVDFVYLDGHSDNLCRYIAEELTTRLYANKKFKIVERRMLEKVLKENALSTSDIMNADAAKKLGGILGVKALVTGSIADKETTIRINARLLATETGEVFDAVAASILKNEDVRKMMNDGTAVEPAQGSGDPKIGKAPSFEDNFDEGLKEGWNPVFGEWRVVQRGLSVINAADGDYRILVGDVNWKNYEISTDVVFAENFDNNLSIIFRAKNNRNMYVARLYGTIGSGEIFEMKILKDGIFSAAISSARVSAYENKVFNFKIEAKNDFFVFYINGAEIASFQDSTFATGQVGLRIQGGSYVRFDNFKVNPLN